MQSMLEEIGYEIVDNVIVYEQAVEVLKTQQVDLVLIDIILASDKTGIDLGKHIRENYDIPFIFVTSNSDRATVENAKTVKPNVYLEVNTIDKKFLVRSPLKDYLEKLPQNKFYRAHKSYIVNVDHIDAINSKDIMINNTLIPISKDFKEFIISAMNS